MAGTIDHLIIDGPYDEPERHWRYEREDHTFSLVPRPETQRLGVRGAATENGDRGLKVRTRA